MTHALIFRENCNPKNAAGATTESQTCVHCSVFIDKGTHSAPPEIFSGKKGAEWYALSTLRDVFSIKWPILNKLKSFDKNSIK